MNAFTSVRSVVVAALVAVAGFSSGQASAYDWNVYVKLTDIEPTYMPARISFAVDTAVAGCPVGALLWWNAKGATAEEKAANTQAVLSVLLSAQAAGRKIQIAGNQADCTVDFLHLPTNS